MHFFTSTLGVTSLLLAGASASTVFSSAVEDFSSEFHWPTPLTSRIIINPHYSSSTAVSSQYDGNYSPPPAVSSESEAKTTTVQTIVVTARPTRTRTSTHYVTPTETATAGDKTSFATTVVAPGISTVISTIYHTLTAPHTLRTSTSYKVSAVPNTTEVDSCTTSATPCFSAVTGRSTLIYTVTAPWTRTYTQVFTVKTSIPCEATNYTASAETEISPTTVDPGVNTITHVSTVFHTVTTRHTLTPASAYSEPPAYPSSTTSAKTNTRTKTSTKTKTGTKTKTKICHPHTTSLIILPPPVEATTLITVETTAVVTHPLLPPVSFPTPIESTPVIIYTTLPPVPLPSPTATNTDGIATYFGTVGTTSKRTSTITASASASASVSAHYSAPPINGGNTVAFSGAGVLMSLCVVAGVMAVL